MSATVVAAVVQMNSGSNRVHNLARTGELLAQAVERGARLVVLPENFAYMGREEEEKRAHWEDPETGPSLTFLREFARREGIWIVGGSVMVARPGEEKATNTCFVVDAGGEVRGRYDKIHLFDVDLGQGEILRESDAIRRGHEAVSVATPFGRVGLSICYDLRFPELYRQLAGQGAELLTIPAAFTLTTGKDHWELLVRARAVENFSYVLAPGQWGRHPGNRHTYGHSLIVEPWGTVVAHCPDGEGVAVAELDLNRVAQCRRRIPCLEHRVLPPLA